MLAAFLVAALAGIAVGGMWLGSAVLARHRAQSAADLAALAAAQRVPAGRSAACLSAEALAAAMGAAVMRCEVDDADVSLWSGCIPVPDWAARRWRRRRPVRRPGTRSSEISLGSLRFRRILRCCRYR